MTIKTALGVVVLAVAMAGYMFRPLSLFVRVLLGLAGVMIMVVPVHNAWTLPLLGIAVAVTIVVALLQRSQRTQST